MSFKYFIYIISFVLLFISATAIADGGYVCKDSCLKIAYVDLDRAINEVSDGRDVKNRLKSEFRSRQKKLDKMKVSLGDLKQAIDKRRPTVSSLEIQSMEKDYRVKFFELQQMLYSYREEMAGREEALTSKIFSRVKKIVGNISRAEGYDIVLEKSQDLILYTKKEIDITNRVIKAYDSRK